MRLIGLIIALVVILLAAMNAGSLSLFVDLGSLIIVLGITIGGLLSSGSGIGILLKALFGADLTGDDVSRAAGACAAARTYAMTSGWIGAVVGTIILLALVDDIGSIGPGLALCLLSILYALTLSYIILHPLEVRLKARAESAEA